MSIKQCPDCGGMGQTEYERSVVDHLNGGYLVDVMDICERCDGYGEIEDEDDE